uniref:Uncharacterized protein n=1 Tax=Strigamia maritima TaxID=126957 RepID=T1JLS9_STRMM
DGSKGYLDGLAVTYAEAFKTHYQDVVEHLESLRRKEVEVAMTTHVKLAPECCSNIYGTVAPSSVHSSPIYKPGKYLPSSCLSDQDEEEIYGYGGYGVYGRRMYKHHANRLACLATPQRCMNPKSTGFYDTCHFSSSTS